MAWQKRSAVQTNLQTPGGRNAWNSPCAHIERGSMDGRKKLESPRGCIAALSRESNGAGVSSVRGERCARAHPELESRAPSGLLTMDRTWPAPRTPRTSMLHCLPPGAGRRASNIDFRGRGDAGLQQICGCIPDFSSWPRTHPRVVLSCARARVVHERAAAVRSGPSHRRRVGLLRAWKRQDRQLRARLGGRHSEAEQCLGRGKLRRGQAAFCVPTHQVCEAAPEVIACFQRQGSRREG